MAGQRGFTLIELIAVIVIIAVVAGTIIPKFVSLEDEATEAAVAGVCSNIESGIHGLRALWAANGSLGAGTTTITTVNIDGQDTNYRDGWVHGAPDSDFIPATVPQRNNNAARTLFLALSATPVIADRNDANATGWVILQTAACDLTGTPRCWEYRSDGVAQGRISYSASQGIVRMKAPISAALSTCSGA